MAKGFHIDGAGPQDPLYGISKKNIVSTLTPHNWRTKAVVRGGRYIWVAEGTPFPNDGDTQYLVQVYVDGTHENELQTRFEGLEAALAYANNLFPEQGQVPEDRPASIMVWGIVRKS